MCFWGLRLPIFFGAAGRGRARQGKARQGVSFMNNGYDREEDEPYHWSVDLVVALVFVGIAAGVASIVW